MKNILAVSTMIIGIFAAQASVAAESYMSSPAFVKQASGSGFSTLDTASIMKPVLDMVAAMPAADARPTAGNLADTLQIGQFNVANIDQTGFGNVGLIQQVGSMNTASITQVGTGHQAFISQRGSNNVAIIRQR
jgi:hypothetical protein